VNRARAKGFDSVNIDLIYGLPLQTRATWAATLEAVIQLRPDRLACFGYAHLPSKIKHQQAIRAEDLPSPRDRLGMLLDANKFFTSSDYVAIGMDHFALPGDELASARLTGTLWRNFMGYTTIRGMELLGFGCSSISEFNHLFAQNITPPDQYAQAIREGLWPVHRGHQLSEEDRLRKFLINQLMCNLEVDVPDVSGRELNGLADHLREAVHSLGAFEADGLVTARNGGFSVTPLGQLFLRNLAMPFDGYLSKQTGATFSRTV
jgi:oxygen-independent coproporphyrinogen III oxidase